MIFLRLSNRGSGDRAAGEQWCNWRAEYSVLKLTSSGSASCPDIIPPLYQSTLLILDSEHFKLRGFERLGLGDDAFAVLRSRLPGVRRCPTSARNSGLTRIGQDYYNARWPRSPDLPGLADELANSVGDPTGIRTPVTAVKGRCPRPLDDGVQKNDLTKVLPKRWWR